MNLARIEASVDNVADAVASYDRPWKDTLKQCVRQGGAAVMALTPKQEVSLRKYHDALSFTKPGGKGRLRPTIRVAPSQKATGGVRLSPDVYMCEHCFKVAPKMAACSTCRRAYYCGAACQKAAWPAHRTGCELRSDNKLLNRDGAILDHGPFFGNVLNPDRPQLCRFWLAAIVNTLPGVAIEHTTALVSPLIAFLWRFTTAAIPKPLDKPLATAVSGLLKKSDELARKISASRLAWQTTDSMIMIAVDTLRGLLLSEAGPWVHGSLLMRRDLVHSNTPPRRQQQGFAWALASGSVQAGCSLLVPRAGMTASPATAEKSDVALLVTQHFRAIGLLSSAFGVLIAPTRMASEIALYAAAAVGKVPAQTLLQQPLLLRATPNFSLVGARTGDIRPDAPEVYNQADQVAAALAQLAASGVAELPVYIGIPKNEDIESANARVNWEEEWDLPAGDIAGRVLAFLPADASGVAAERAAAVRAAYAPALASDVHSRDGPLWPAVLSLRASAGA